MTGLEKATLTNTVTGRRVSVQFNPEEYTLDRETTFAQLAVPGLSAPVVQFVAGNAQTIQLDLLVDTTEASLAGAAGADVRRLVRDVTSLMDIDPGLHAPPPVIFAWGDLHVHVRRAEGLAELRAVPRPTARRCAPGSRSPSASTATSSSRRRRSSGRRSTTPRPTWSPRATACRFSLTASTRTPPPGGRSRCATASSTRVCSRSGTTLVDAAASVHRSARRRARRPHRTGGVMSTVPGYAPEFRLVFDGRPAPATLRASVTSVSATCGFGDADRLEVALANEGLRWLDDDLFRLDTPVELWLGYAPDRPAAGVRGRGGRRGGDLPERRHADAHRRRAGPAHPPGRSAPSRCVRRAHPDRRDHAAARPRSSRRSPPWSTACFPCSTRWAR